MKYIQAAIPDDLHTAVAVQAKKEGLTLSGIMEISVRAYLENKRKEDTLGTEETTQWPEGFYSTQTL